MQKLKTISQCAYDGWFSKVTPVKIDGNGTIVLGVSDSFFAEWLETHYHELIDEVFEVKENHYKVEFVTGYQPQESDEEIVPEPVVAPVAAAVAPAPPQKLQNCLSLHTFSNFVVGEENRYAYTAAKMASESPGVYNPLYIHGGTGVGKTHLLQAVAHAAKNANPASVIRYASCEELLNDFLELLQQKRNLVDFRASVRDVDILLVDDVHILGKAPRMQEEFFNMFNTLYNNRKQIILTSDKQPCEIEGLEDRLVSRFESGMTTEISPPEFEARLAILKMMREQNEVKFKLDASILEFIAANIASSVRRLKGAFIRVATFASIHPNKPITLDVAEGLLETILAKESLSKTVLIDDIQKVVSDFFGLKVSDILSDKRPKNIAEPRMVAMYLSRKLTKHSLPEIGQAFGRNHATILNAMKKIPELCEKSEDFRRGVGMIERQLLRH